jgi:UDP-N-acetylmuramoyl-L-alanyl-D-glutamate--2,6-diaminopimelate ligase
MDQYFAAKAALFEKHRSAAAVVNADDVWGRRLLEKLEIPASVYRWADAEDLDLGLTGSRFRWRGHPVTIYLGGSHNVANALAAATAAELLGIEAAVVAAGLGSLPGVPGRSEPIDAGQPFTVLVDYAHTPDGIEHILRSVRAATASKVTIVFGCGGDRDRPKRPLMTAVATTLADRVVLTSDNPRSEDPMAIIAEAAAGATRPEVLVIEPDRAVAIRVAVAGAGAGDVVVIAGKGHETGQIIGDQVLAFDDREVARQALTDLGYREDAR